MFSVAFLARQSGDLTVPRATLLKLTIAVEGGLLAAAVLLGWGLGEHFWIDATVSAGAIVTGAALGLVLLALAVVAVDGPFPVTSGIRRDIDRMMGIFRDASMVDLLLISILAGMGEEAFFRGFLQAAAAGQIGVPAAVILVSLCFGALHWISPGYAAFAAILGLAFGILYLYTENIVVPMVAHAGYDFAALVYGLRYRGHTRV